VTRPAQQLAGFARIDLAPGAARRIIFRLDSSQLGYTNLGQAFAVEACHVDFYLGLAADDRQLEGGFDVVGQPRTLTSAERSFLSSTIVNDLGSHH
jgi:hypothetical protein